MPTLGVRGVNKSEAAIMAATTKATVVKKPNVFCNLTREEYMAGYVVARSSASLVANAIVNVFAIVMVSITNCLVGRLGRC